MKDIHKPHQKLLHCKQRVDQLKTCFEITSLLNSELNLDHLLDTIMNTAKNVMKADACTLMLIDREHCDLVFQVVLSDVGEQIKKLGKDRRLKIGEGVAGTVARTGQPMLIKDAYKHPSFNPEYDEQTGFITGSILCSPVKLKGEVLGVCQVIHHRSKKKVFSGADLSLFRMFCESAALAILNARAHQTMMEMQRMERDMEFALSVQQSFLPKEVPGHKGFAFAAKTSPARRVGGDFYDFIPFDSHKLAMVLGDVSGKGVSAALQMARLMSDFRFISQINPEPARVLQEVNKTLCNRSKGGMFTTAVYLVLDLKEKTIEVANAGHHCLLLRDINGNVATKGKASGPPLGVLPDSVYKEEKFALKKGETVFLYTDGVTEPRNKKNNQFGLDKLCDMLKKNEKPLDEFIIDLEKSIQKFTGKAEQFDDLTILTFKVL